MLTAEEFLGMSVTGSLDTKIIPIPEGDYLASVASEGVGLADFKYKKGDREGQTGYRMTVKWELVDPDKVIENQIARPPTITQSIMLDTTASGGLDMGKGKNIQLGRLREAVGQNTDGKPWMPAMLIGQTARIFVKHRIGDNGETMQNVDNVTKA